MGLSLEYSEAWSAAAYSTATGGCSDHGGVSLALRYTLTNSFVTVSLDTIQTGGILVVQPYE